MGDKVKITKTVFDRAAPQATRQTIMDSELSGFGLRVEPSGVKTFFVRYRADGGGRSAPQRLMTIAMGGRTVEQVRTEAKRLLGFVAAGGDPAGERSQERKAETVADLIDLYEREGLIVQRGIRQGEPMKPLTAKLTMARLRAHVMPLLGRRKAKDIGAGDIERFVRDVAAGKTAKDEKTGPRTRVIVTGGDGAARKVVRDMSAMFSFAVRRGIVPANPVSTAAVRKTDGRSETYLSLDDLTRLGAVLAAMVAEGMPSKVADGVRLLALTGCRRNEILGLRWSEIDLEAGLLRLEDTKTGRSLRPLPAAAAAILARIEKTHGSDFVFPASTGAGFYTGTKRFWPVIRRRAELPPEATLHSLRHSVGALSASSGESILVVGAILGHANPRSTSVYAHVAQDPAKRAADRIAATVDAAMGGHRRAEVVVLKR
jgi:integrase